jgi:hypothetical protein
MCGAALRLLENDPPSLLSITMAVWRFRLDQAQVAAVMKPHSRIPSGAPKS